MAINGVPAYGPMLVLMFFMNASYRISNEKYLQILFS